MSDREQLDHLIARYERVAAEADERADGLVSLAFRNGWTDDLAHQVEQLRHQAETNRGLAQEVRDGMAP